LEDDFSAIYQKEIDRINNKHIPRLIKQYTKDVTRILETDATVEDIINDLKDDSNLNERRINQILKRFKNALNTFQYDNMKRNVEQATAGTPFWAMPIPEDGVISSTVLQEFTDTNSKLIQEIVFENAIAVENTTARVVQSQVAQLTQKAITVSQSVRELSKEIKSATGVVKRKADFWARDQIKLAHGNLEKARFQEAQIPGYVWSTVGDGRVRPEHMGRHGIFYRNGEISPEPGEDFLCRCTRYPAFDQSAQLSKTQRAKDVAFMKRDAESIALQKKNKSLRKKITKTKRFKTVKAGDKAKRVSRIQKQIQDNKKRVSRISEINNRQK
jgi:SPP1 gp7 family putative phage head morphogenesis protein